VFFQDPASHAWHPLGWTGLPPAGQVPAFGDARVRDLLKKAEACGLAPRSDAELLPVLLELIGGTVPVSSWPTQLSKAQRIEHAREVAQADAAHTDRPRTPPADLLPPPARKDAVGTPLRWPDRAGSAAEAVDAERRRRREQVVPFAPRPPRSLGASFREHNVFVIPDEDEEDGEGAGPA
jgi:hypothetical protein